MDWGLTRAGFNHAWFCESSEFCRRVLAARWPDVPIYEDVRTLSSPERVDLLAGGFPCQDLSVAGRRTGIGGQRSGLWTEYARLIGELRPRYVFVENVAGLLVRGMGVVLGDLASLGYDAEWDCLPAAAFGAPHLRARIFILAYPDRGLGLGTDDTVFAGRRAVTGSSSLVDTQCISGDVLGLEQERRRSHETEQAGMGSNGSGAMADAEREGLQGSSGRGESGTRRSPILVAGHHEGNRGQWVVEPDVGRVAHGVPDRVDRLTALGNGVVPQIAEYVGRRILDHERKRAVTA